ncbi:MAG: hypothetical protein ACO3P1_01990 [Pseudomonadales bacterium]|jgi:hypothetical protein
MLTYKRSAALLALLLGVTLSVTGHAAEAYKRWDWFKDTYWIVPEAGIYSIAHSADDNSFKVVRGQTVFHITDTFNGYFTGSVVVKLTSLQFPTCTFVLGQVTPSGSVHMTMYDTETGEVRNYPIGQMEKRRGEWTMVNQMTSPTIGGTLSHWAYMIQSKPGMATYNSLPFARESIPDFMSACPPGPMIDRQER